MDRTRGPQEATGCLQWGPQPSELTLPHRAQQPHFLFPPGAAGVVWTSQLALVLLSNSYTKSLSSSSVHRFSLYPHIRSWHLTGRIRMILTSVIALFRPGTTLNMLLHSIVTSPVRGLCHYLPFADEDIGAQETCLSHYRDVRNPELRSRELSCAYITPGLSLPCV